MKKLLGIAIAVALFSLTNAAFADEQLGKKIYERASGRGCGTCHDIDSNPQLKKLIKDGKLDKKTFADVLEHGKGNGKMPKALQFIMDMEIVRKAGLTKEQAVDTLYNYLKDAK